MFEFILGLGFGIIGALQVATILIIIFHLGRKIDNLGPTIVSGIAQFMGPRKPEQVEEKRREIGFAVPDKERKAIHQKHEKRLSTYVKELSELLPQKEKQPNPMSTEKINRFKSYLDRVKRGELLSSAESKEFMDLGNEIRGELPKERKKTWDYLLAGFLGFSIGLLVGYLITKK
ncbi:hypothetical protein CEE35_06835 [Candidatus Aerophobetes bacterium Ae_b3b]|nr:MAG: hypothetical protein CEE35_06835 [Candidatus Aerophobetes bacterium Ae_b3b]